MKIKNMKLMLLGLLAMGSMNAFAQTITFKDANFNYTTTTVPNEVTLTSVENAITGGEWTIPGTVQNTSGGVTTTYKVTKIASAALNNQAGMTSLSIPAEVKEIETNALKGCTNLTTLTFAENSQLTTLGTSAFATTQIAEFDFKNCSKLTGFPDLLFVESGKTNTFITKIEMPTTSTFKNIGTALASLTNLATTNIADTKIQSVVANAFKGDDKLVSMELPGTVKTIASGAFTGSKVATLTINIGSIDASTGIAANVYGSSDKNTLTSLTLKGELKGKIAQDAFTGSAKLATLDLSGLSFGTNASIEKNAFGGIALIEEITLGNIGDNGTGTAYTIQTNAFNGAKLAKVTIGNITANRAIAANAFDDGTTNTLTSVKLGNVYSGGLAIAANAFMFAEIADDKTGSVEIGNVRATSMTPIFGAGAFTLAAKNANKAFATIKIGAVESAGQVFTASTFTLPTTNTFKSVSVTFDGDIEYNGIDEVILSQNTELTALTFNGKIGAGGIGADGSKKPFASMPDGAVVTFKGSLAAGAVAAGAFELATVGTTKLTVKYTGTPEDASVNPFSQAAFAGTAGTFPTAITDDSKRTVTLDITNEELKTLIASQQISATAAAKNNDIIYAVVMINKESLGLRVWLKEGTNTSYGRFNLADAGFLATLTNGITIPRRQNGITYTLYTTYVENDATNKVVTINMQPMVSTDGKYVIAKGDIALSADKVGVIIIKAVGTTKEYTDVEYTDEGASTNKFYCDGQLKVYNGTDNVTNQQLVDNTTTVTDFQNLFNAKGEALKDIYFLSNPENHKGITANTWDIKKAGVYVAPKSYYIVADHYDKAAAARIVWLDGGEEATGISAVKNVAEDGVIYNLAGQQVDANYKGIVIKNGKKMIQK